MRHTRAEWLAVVALALAATAGAQGMMGSAGNGLPNGAGMVVVASDGSVIVTQMGMSMMGSPSGGSASLQRAIVDIGPDGKERWRATFTDGWPMMAAANGDLVVAVLVNNGWMWQSMSSMGWWPFGNNIPATTTDAALVGLDLATGTQLWKTSLPGDMASWPQFTADGSRMYVSVTDFGSGGMMGGGGSLRQGDTGGWATQMTNKVVALDRNGTILWTADLSSSGGMMH